DGVELLARVELADERRIAVGAGHHRHRLDVLLVDLADEVGISDLVAGSAARAAVDHLDEPDEREEDADPDQQALGPRVAGLLFLVVHRSSFAGKTPIALK